MQVNTQLLQKEITDAGLTIEKFCKEIGVNPSTFYRQQSKGFLNMTIGQMHATVKVLKLSNEKAVIIFLEENSQ